MSKTDWFFSRGDDKKKTRSREPTVEFMHRMGCKICPLDRIKENKNPHTKPSGSNKPLVYCLGEGNGHEEDLKGIPFVGPAGKLLRRNIPNDWIDDCRFNNVVRTRARGISPKTGAVINLEPPLTAIECCRPSVWQDILETNPKAIFGFGNYPLFWAGITQEVSSITLWNGRKVPILIDRKPFWFFPMIHPSHILRNQNEDKKDKIDYEFVFKLDLKRGFEQVENLPEPIVHSIKDAESNIEILTGENSDDFVMVVEFIKELYNWDYVGIDYETKNMRPYGTDSRLLTISLSHENYTIAFPWDHPGSKFSDKEKKLIKKEFEDFLYEAPCKKIAHSLPFEHEWSAYLFGENCLRAQPWEDTLSQSYIIDERPQTHDLDFLVLQYFGLHLKNISNLDKNNLDKEPLSAVLPYNAMDSKYHRLLYFEQAKELKRQGMEEVYRHQLRRIPTMVLTQLKGVPVDQEVVKKFHKEYTAKIKEIEAEIAADEDVQKFKRKFSYDFRPSAPKDVLLFFNKVVKKTIEKTGEEILKTLEHPVAKLILEYREWAKLLSTYVKPLMKDDEESQLHPDGLLHPILKATTTRTWRTSSGEPNSQNFSKHEHKEVRAQIKHKFNKIVAFDYAGIQARNVAQESKDKSLVNAFWNSYDIHADWARRTAEKFPEWNAERGIRFDAFDKDLFKQYRQIAKNRFVFASFFGAQPPNISTNMQIPLEIAQELQEDLWYEFPDIHGWQERIKKDYQVNGYVTGLSGFRRHAPISPNQIINSPIQSDESIIVCSAMARLSEMEEDKFQANLEVHDDLSFIWPQEDIEKNSEVVVREMTRIAFSWQEIVPIDIEMSVGDSWADVKEIAKFSSCQIWGHKR